MEQRKTVEYGYGAEKHTYRKIGTIQTGAERIWRESGETACNYTEYHMAGYQDLDLYAWGNEGSFVLLTFAEVSILESYYQNRVFHATSDSRSTYDIGENVEIYTFTAGHHSHLGTNVFRFVKSAFNGRLKLEGYRLDAEQVGNYDNGEPFFRYRLVELAAATEAA